MSMKPLQKLVRPNIWALKPYSSARDEYKGAAASVFLDANENPYNAPYNRYPDPLQLEVKEMLAPVKGVKPGQIFLGNGSDEAIDLAFRIFCEPKTDNVVAIAPTYGMYKVCADINDVAYRPVLLDDGFRLDAGKLLAAADEHTKLIFLCSPNNPSGNDLEREEIVKVLERFPGMVVIDEAYADFSEQKPFREELETYPNLIVLNTFSKAWGSAAIRLGMAFASEEVISLFNKVKYPYNVNQLTQRQAVEILKKRFDVDKWVKTLLRERGQVMAAFAAGESDILVSTTVVEVGVDVPNANLMVVENAERFGLSQLHQLRGRVGRGSAKSWCVLLSDSDNEDTRRRLKVLTETNDGFRISEEDLKLRGPGDFFGQRQHGLPTLKAADLSCDMRLLEEAQSAANNLLDGDPSLSDPAHAPLHRRIDRLFAVNEGGLN